ncbi:MAG: chemotaxis-specific protein-glutamate methyltransferase CheB [Anaerolineae bacterium]|nr:chemotaxis-specific protein-glutamate methyltransferase CheB [Anaerolineae bacterium]
MNDSNKIGVLIVEDSLVTRRFLADLIDGEPDMHVIGEAGDGAEALHLLNGLKPDVISMDISMPAMDGLEATRRIMAEHPTPIVVVSATLQKKDVDLAFEALQAGALAAVEKPPGSAHPDFEAKRGEMITTIRLMAKVRVVRRRPSGIIRVARPGGAPPAPPRPAPLALPVDREPRSQPAAVAQLPPGAKPLKRPQVAALGASAGGPAALVQVLSGLPKDFPIPVLVVQHLAHDFLPGLARWLDQSSQLEVRLAEEGDRLRAGVVYLAPGHAHMTVDMSRRVHMVHTRGAHRHQPSATVLFESVARVYGEAAIGVILTGMGDDGAAGLRAMCDAGAPTLVQDEQSCVVFGMPAAAIACGAARYIVPLESLAAAIQELL